jgi:DNA-binding XRE family transcriptional regulator
MAFVSNTFEADFIGRDWAQIRGKPSHGPKPRSNRSVQLKVSVRPRVPECGHNHPSRNVHKSGRHKGCNALICVRETNAQESTSGLLARNMRRLRAARGLSQEALAHESGINRTYLSAIERSERNVSIDNIARIARGLGVEAWTLLKDT